MGFTTLTVRRDVARRLKAAKTTGESYSDTLNRLLESQPAQTVEEWLASLTPLVGRGIFSEASRDRLKKDQKQTRRSPRRRRAAP
jgi:hypothetical protein